MFGSLKKKQDHQRLFSASFVKKITPARVFYQKVTKKVIAKWRKKETKICIN
jgi:hypothetical protein